MPLARLSPNTSETLIRVPAIQAFCRLRCSRREGNQRSCFLSPLDPPAAVYQRSVRTKRVTIKRRTKRPMAIRWRLQRPIPGGVHIRAGAVRFEGAAPLFDLSCPWDSGGLPWLSPLRLNGRTVPRPGRASRAGSNSTQEVWSHAPVRDLLSHPPQTSKQPHRTCGGKKNEEPTGRLGVHRYLRLGEVLELAPSIDRQSMGFTRIYGTLACWKIQSPRLRQTFSGVDLYPTLIEMAAVSWAFPLNQKNHLF